MPQDFDNQNEANEVGLHVFDYWQVLRNRYGVILLTFLLIFITAAVITYVLPRKYLSKSVVQVHPAVQTLNPFGGGEGQVIGAVSSRAYMPTEFKVIEAEQTMKMVEERLDLAARWNLEKQSVVGILKGIVSTENVLGTDLIEIKVRYTNPNDARDIAAEVANAYIERRNNTELDRAEKALAALDSELQDQENLVEEKRKVLYTIVQSFGIPYVEGGGVGGNIGESENSIYLTAERELYDSEREKQQLDIQIKTLLKLESDEMMKYAAGLNLPNNGVPALFERYQEQLREQASMKASGLGAQHPTMEMLQINISNLRTDLGKAVDSLRVIMQTQLDLVEGRLEEMGQVVRDRRTVAVDRALESHEYVESRRQYENAQSMLQQMKLQHSSKRISLKIPKNPITIHEEPKAGRRPVSPKVTLYLTLGAVVGLVFGIAIAFFLEHLDTSVKSLEEVERYLQVPVLAVIPKDVGVLHKQSGMSPDAEAYRILRTNIEFNRKNPEDNAITLVSGGAGEGKSTTLVNLAYVCAQGGYTTLMIDADLRRPRLHTFFDINNSVGLTNYLTTDLMLEDVILQTPVDSLYFLPSGILPADAAGILNSRRMSELIQDVKQRFDLILVDSPPILGVSDASVLASEVDLTMIVVQHRKLPRNMLMRVKQSIENVGGQVIGVVLNNVDVRSDSQYQYYTSYYTYYAPSADGDTPKSTDLATRSSSSSKKTGQVADADQDNFEDDLY